MFNCINNGDDFFRRICILLNAYVLDVLHLKLFITKLMRSTSCRLLLDQKIEIYQFSAVRYDHWKGEGMLWDLKRITRPL